MAQRSARGLASQALYEVKTVAARYPAVALPVARMRGRNHPITADTQLVIEGFPRSASSFAVAAFELSQPEKPRLAHHVHAPAQVIEAARRGVPVILLIRAPEETVLSFVIRHPQLTLGQALRGYARFYEPLVGYRESVVVGTFPRVTTSFGEVVARVNARFGTSFSTFDHTPDNVDRCMNGIARYVRANHPPERYERVVPTPSAERERLKDALRPRYRAESLRRLRRRGEVIYTRFADL